MSGSAACFLTRQFHAVGRDAEAEQCSRKNLAYTKELNGENSLQYIESQIRLAQAEEWSGMIVQGCQDYLQAEERLERWVRDRLRIWMPMSARDFGVPSQSCSRS